MAQIGMPGKRVAALQGFARGGRKRRRAARQSCAVDTAALRAALLALPGIGPWTVEYVAMRAWRDADAWPAWDLVLMQSIAARDPALLRPTQQRARTDAVASVACLRGHASVERSGGPRGCGTRRLAPCKLREWGERGSRARRRAA